MFQLHPRRGWPVQKICGRRANQLQWRLRSEALCPDDVELTAASDRGLIKDQYQQAIRHPASK